MNEPHGYSASERTNLAASWINSRSSIPRGRILVSGTGYSQDLRPVCADSRLSGTLLSYHHYTFFYGGPRTEPAVHAQPGMNLIL